MSPWLKEVIWRVTTVIHEWLTFISIAKILEEISSSVQKETLWVPITSTAPCKWFSIKTLSVPCLHSISGFLQVSILIANYTLACFDSLLMYPSLHSTHINLFIILSTIFYLYLLHFFKNCEREMDSLFHFLSRTSTGLYNLWWLLFRFLFVLFCL